MALRMFTSRGDYILSEEYTFATAIETARPMGVKVIGVKMDAEGLLPASLDDILSNWDKQARGAKKPFLLYTVPSGQNPTGATQSAQRRRELYRCCQKHDLYILEDEPYYFLQMQPYTGPNAPDVPPPASHEEFIKALVPSLLSMDVDGRVMRMDSFSKVLAPGTRVGWITASEQIVERYEWHQEASLQNPSGISQLVLFKLLDEAWGHAGYLDWLINLRLEYTKRRDIICYACEKYLPREVASWNPPMAGMFVSPPFRPSYLPPLFLLPPALRYDIRPFTNPAIKALDQNRLPPPPTIPLEIHARNRRRNLSCRHRPRRALRQRFLLPRRGRRRERHVFPHNFCGCERGEYHGGYKEVWRGAEECIFSGVKGGSKGERGKGAGERGQGKGERGEGGGGTQRLGRLFVERKIWFSGWWGADLLHF